jgi:hypothetical protein
MFLNGNAGDAYRSRRILRCSPQSNLSLTKGAIRAMTNSAKSAIPMAASNMIASLALFKVYRLLSSFQKRFTPAYGIERKTPERGETGTSALVPQWTAMKVPGEPAGRIYQMPLHGRHTAVSVFPSPS